MKLMYFTWQIAFNLFVLGKYIQILTHKSEHAVEASVQRSLLRSPRINVLND